MKPNCRVRVEKLLDRHLNEGEVREIDARINRSHRYLAAHEPDFAELSRKERLIRSGEHAAELIRHEAEDTVRAFDIDFRLRQSGRDLLGEDFDRLEQAGRIAFADRASDLPQFRDGADDDALAVTLDDGRVVLFRDHMTPDTMGEVLLHEVGVHAGMEAYLGPKGWQDLLADVEAAVKAREPQAMEAAARVPEETAPAHIMEEVLAYWVQGAPANDALVKKWLGKMRAWIYRHIPFVRGRVSLTNGMLRELADGALRRAARQSRKFVPSEAGYLRAMQAGGGRFSKPSRVMSFDQFSQEMLQIRKDWAPDEIARAYELHKLHMKLTAPTQLGTGGAAVSDTANDAGGEAKPDVGLQQAALQDLPAPARGGPELVQESEALEAGLRAAVETDPEFDGLEVIHPETGERVRARQLLDDLDADRAMLDRLRGCAYPGGVK